jgi:hypothetical protein
VSSPSLYRQTALPGAAPREWTYVAEFYADTPVQLVVDAGGKQIVVDEDAFVRDGDFPDRCTARVECLDVFHQPSARGTVTGADGESSAAEAVAPQNAIEERFSIDQGTDATLEEHFARFFQMMEGAPPARITVSYHDVAEVPIVLVPAMDEEPALAGMIASAIRQWFTQMKPTIGNEARFVVTFTTPTLTLNNATINLASVSDLHG